MLSRFVAKGSRMAYQGSQLEKSIISRVPFSHSWNNLVKQYDLRMWYLQNGVDQAKRHQYVLELENLQKEMNAEGINISTKRIVYMLVAFWVTMSLFTCNPVLDWNEHWDLKFDRALYGDLEDGGDEGGDDD